MIWNKFLIILEVIFLPAWVEEITYFFVINFHVRNFDFECNILVGSIFSVDSIEYSLAKSRCQTFVILAASHHCPRFTASFKKKEI